MKKTYLIASAVERSHYFPEAYLFEIEFIKDVPPMFDISSGEKSLYKNDRNGKSSFIPIHLIRINKIVCRASGGDRCNSYDYYDKKATEESKKENPFEIDINKKIYFRKKLSKCEYRTFVNKIFVMPEANDGLLFEEETEEKAVSYFKELCKVLYFGVLNDNIYLHDIPSRDWKRDTSLFLMGKSNFIGNNKIYKANKDDEWHFKNDEDNLYLEFEQDSYNIDVDIDSTFWKKILFVMNTMQQEDYKTLNSIYEVVKELYPNIKGVYLGKASFYSIGYNIMPRPIYPFELCFTNTSNTITEEKLIAPNLKEFLLNRDYFIMTNESEDYLNPKNSILKIISDDIIIKRIDGDTKKIKDFIKEKEKK